MFDNIFKKYFCKYEKIHEVILQEVFERYFLKKYFDFFFQMFLKWSKVILDTLPLASTKSSLSPKNLDEIEMDNNLK